MIGTRMSTFGMIATIAVGLAVAGATAPATARGGGHGGSGIAVARPAPIVRPSAHATAIAAPVIRPETVYNSSPLFQSQPRSRSAPVTRPSPLAQKRPQVRRGSKIVPTYASSDATGGGCDQFREQAIASGNGIWWDRYYDCTGDYYGAGAAMSGDDVSTGCTTHPRGGQPPKSRSVS